MSARPHLEKAARLSALIEAQQRGWLDHLNRSEIARALRYNRSTLTRDFEDIEKFLKMKQRYLDILDAEK